MTKNDKQINKQTDILFEVKKIAFPNDFTKLVNYGHGREKAAVIHILVVPQLHEQGSFPLRLYYLIKPPLIPEFPKV